MSTALKKLPQLIVLFGAFIVMGAFISEPGKNKKSDYSISVHSLNQSGKKNIEYNDSMVNMTVVRTFDAPVKEVWKAWSDSALVKQWWGPNGFTAPVAKIDFKVGGVSLVCMRMSNGFEIYNTWSYKKITPKKEIEFVQHFSDKDGKQIDPVSMGMPPGIPAEVKHIIYFEKLGKKKTKLTVTEYGYKDAKIVEMSKAGMNECLDKMEAIFKNSKQ